MNYSDIFKEVSPKTVVVINKNLVGSGFIVDKDGYIATAEHVVANNNNVAVLTSFTYPKTIGAKVINRDKSLDIALLKIDFHKKLFPVRIGDSSAVIVGDEIAIIGFPFGNQMWKNFIPAIHRGIISCIVKFRDGTKRFQLDIMANKGNSGGPLILKDDGKVIGILNKIWIDEPLGKSIIIGGKTIQVPTGIALATPIEHIEGWLKNVKTIAKPTTAKPTTVKALKK